MIMKLLVIIFSSLLSFSEAFCQGGNLQFNRVLNFTSGANYTVPQGKVLKIESTKFNLSLVATLNYIGCDTTVSYDLFQAMRFNHYCKYSSTNNAHSVQIGPIKIGGFEQAGLYNGYPYQLFTMYNYDCSVCPATTSAMYRIGTSDELNCPLWLSEGEVVSIFPYLQLLGPYNYGVTGVFGIYISAIEFNVVP